MARVLVIGSGGREHALCQTFQKSKQVETVYCAPGNPGMALDAIVPVNLSETDFTGLIRFAKRNAIDLTFVGPEVPLSKGIVDAFQEADLAIFGPKKASAQLESSKSFAKEFMKRHDIPTASSETFRDGVQALSYVVQQPTPIVIKVDGLAAGKGVAIAKSRTEAQEILQALYAHNPEQTVVIEDYLVGQEFSFMCFVNQAEVLTLPLSQDHKRLLDQDAGPNTGGMGAYSPLPQLPQSLTEVADQEIIQPTVQGLVEEGLGFAGVIYVGLILTSTGLKVIEYNMRLGDPETQVLLPRLESDFYEMIQTLLAGQVPEVRWQKTGYTLGVVVAAKGYPKHPQKGIIIPDLTNTEAIQVTYAGVTEKAGQLVSSGGRVLALTTTQKTIEACQTVLYHFLDQRITDPLIYRHDIGMKAIKNS